MPTPELVESCLRHGAWAPSPPRPLDATLVSMEALRVRKKAMFCTRRRKEIGVERHRWQGSDPRCASALHDPLSGSFDGVFADPDKPVAVAVLAASVGRQVQASLMGVAKANPHLRGLVFPLGSAAAEAALNPLSMSVLPRTAAGVRALLGAIRWPQGAAARIVVAEAAAYSMVPWCNTSASRADPVCAYTTRPSIPPNDPLAAPVWPEYAKKNRATRLGVPKAPSPIWGWQEKLRKYTTSAMGTAADGLSAREYERDVGNFMRTMAPAGRLGSEVRVLWYQNPPLHLRAGVAAGQKPPSSRSAEPCDARPEAAGYGTDIPGWSALPRAIEAVPRDFLDKFCPRAQRLADLSGAECGPRIATWQDSVAARHARAHGVPIIPLREALSDPAHLQLHEPDCVHWCEGSEVTQQMALAVLNSVRAVLQAAPAGGAPTANRRFVKTVKNATRAAARASRASAKASAAGGAARQKGAFQRFGEWLHGKG